MILAVLGLGLVGLWFVVAGDGPGRLVGVVLLLAGLFGFLLWVALFVDRPGAADPGPFPEVRAHG